MQDKLKNWEELCNDGENYAGKGENLSPKEKILFENIKDKKVLKIQDAYLFSKTGKIEENHGCELAEMIAHFPFVKTISSMIITHNRLGPKGLQILTSSPVLPKVNYLLCDITNKKSLKRSISKYFDYVVNLAKKASKTLDEEGVAKKNRTTTYQVDIRYHGQGLLLTVDFDLSELRRKGLNAIGATFDEMHEQLFTFALPA